VEQREDKKQMKPFSLSKIIKYRIQREMKKGDTQFWTPTKQR
jgi:hypothetical protein